MSIIKGCSLPLTRGGREKCHAEWVDRDGYSGVTGDLQLGNRSFAICVHILGAVHQLHMSLSVEIATRVRQVVCMQACVPLKILFTFI